RAPHMLDRRDAERSVPLIHDTDHDPRALTREAGRDGFAEPRSGPGHDRDLAVESHVALPSAARLYRASACARQTKKLGPLAQLVHPEGRPGKRLRPGPAEDRDREGEELPGQALALRSDIGGRNPGVGCRLAAPALRLDDHR